MLIKTNNEKTYVTVSDLSRALNQSLEKTFPEVYFQGEIHELARATSGHLYFSLKDDKGKLTAVMWKGMTASLKFVPKPGLQVLCHGRPNIYAANGKLQIVVHYMTEAGEGLLQKKFLELKAKLEQEGIFAIERKRPIPFLPKAVGLVTSSTGAVVHDMMVKIHQRMPNQKVFLIDVRVQGEGASQEIASAIEMFNAQNLVDVIIVARGGGSLEDLWAFNEEKTVRAIFASRIPVVSGVGHEVDTTLADYAADLRAPTPTAAAEAVVPKRDDLFKNLDQLQRRLADYQRWLAPLQQRVDELNFRLDSSISSVVRESRLHLQALSAKVDNLEPRKLIALLNARLDSYSGRLNSSYQRHIEREEKRLALFEPRLLNAYQAALKNFSHLVANYSARLESVNPAKVLSRGYAIVESAGKVVRKSSDLAIGKEVMVTLAQGTFEAAVKDIKPK